MKNIITPNCDLIMSFLFKMTYPSGEDRCIVCDQTCDEQNGWKCEKCKKSVCTEHNRDPFECDCDS